MPVAAAAGRLAKAAASRKGRHFMFIDSLIECGGRRIDRKSAASPEQVASPIPGGALRFPDL
jgi:hypothetical protein